MRTIFYLIQKEFIQVFRNKSMLPIIFVVPIVQMLILVNAATLEMKSIKMVIVDNDLSSSSASIISKFTGSPFYKISKMEFSLTEAEEELRNGRADVVMVINKDFEKSIVNGTKAEVQLLVNAINGVSAGLIYAYSNGIIASYSKDVSSRMIGRTTGMQKIKNITITNSHWYNPELKYSAFMVPGILVILVTMIGLFLSGLNIVREKEIGTIEQINVTPIRKTHFMIGKLLPFWMLALLELAFGLTLGKLIFNIPIEGSILLIFFMAAIYLVSVLAMGLLISTFANTQQQAMFIIFFFMIIFIMLSGLFTSVDNIQVWAKIFNKINPVAYFVKIMRMILLKGSGFHDILREFVSLVVLSILLMSLAVRRYRKTV